MYHPQTQSQGTSNAPATQQPSSNCNTTNPNTTSTSPEQLPQMQQLLGDGGLQQSLATLMGALLQGQQQGDVKPHKMVLCVRQDLKMGTGELELGLCCGDC